jgi:hypothetical protein
MDIRNEEQMESIPIDFVPIDVMKPEEKATSVPIDLMNPEEDEEVASVPIDEKIP